MLTVFKEANVFSVENTFNTGLKDFLQSSKEYEFSIHRFKKKKNRKEMRHHEQELAEKNSLNQTSNDLIE